MTSAAPVLLLFILLALLSCQARKYIFYRSSNPVIYSENECNTTVVWMSTNESQDIGKLSLHTDLCQTLPRDVGTIKKVTIDDSIVNDVEKLGYFNLVSFYDLNYLLNIGSLRKFTEKQTRFFIIREAIGPFRIIAMIYDNRNLRLNLINPEDTLSAIRPKQIACVMSSCPFYSGNETCFLPNIKDKLRMSQLLMNEDFPDQGGSSRLSIYQVQAIVLGFLCIVFGLACVLFCVYAFKTTRYHNQINNSKLMINNLKAHPPVFKPAPEGNYLQIPKSNSFAVLKALNSQSLDNHSKMSLYQNFENRQSLILKPNPSDDSFLRNYTPSLLGMPASKSMQFSKPTPGNGPNNLLQQHHGRPKSIMKLGGEHKFETKNGKEYIVTWPDAGTSDNQ